MNVFVSYSRDDADQAAGVVAALQARGVEVWWDQRIGLGEAFREKIDAKLAECDFVVVIWSDASIKSKWVVSEALTARDQGRLISVALGAAVPPLGFRQFQFLRLDDAGDDLERLAGMVHGLDGARPEEVLRERGGFLTLDFSRRYRLNAWKSAGWALILAAVCGAIASPVLVDSRVIAAYMVGSAFLSLWIGRLVLPDPAGAGRITSERLFELHPLAVFVVAMLIVGAWLGYIAIGRSAASDLESVAAPNVLRMVMLWPLAACGIYVVPSVALRLARGLGLYRTQAQRVKVDVIGRSSNILQREHPRQPK